MAAIFPDTNKRFWTSIAVSVVANVGLWYLLSLGSTRVLPFTEPPVLEFTRVTMDEKGIKREKIVKPLEVKKKIAEVKPPKPLKPEPTQPKSKTPPPPPQGAHNKVEVAKTTNPTPNSQSFSAPTDGNAKVGVPTDGQKQGNAVTNPPTNPPPTTPPEKQTDTNPPPADPPKPVDPPKPPPAPPPPPPPPKPKGPTQDAAPTKTVDPEIPDNLKSDSFKSHVHVKVTVAADGSFEVVLRTTSGNPDVDKVVLDCLKKWKWKPALKDGEPVESDHLFLFEFEVK